MRAVKSPQFLTLKRALYLCARLLWEEILETLTKLSGIRSKVTITAPIAAHSFKP